MKYGANERLVGDAKAPSFDSDGHHVDFRQAQGNMETARRIDVGFSHGWTIWIIGTAALMGCSSDCLDVSRRVVRKIFGGNGRFRHNVPFNWR